MGGQQSQDVNYVYQMPNSREPGFTPVYRNSKFYQDLKSTPDPSIKNYRDVIVQSCLHKFPNHKLAGKIVVKKQAKQGQQAEKEIQSMTYKEVFDKSQLLGKAILGMKLQSRQKTQNMGFIGIYSKNRIQWLFTDFACTLFGLTSVPLYDTLGLQNLTYCLKQTQMTTLFATEATLKILLTIKDHGNLKNVVLYDRVDQQTVSKANKIGLTIIDFERLIEEGKRFSHIKYQDIVVKPQDIYTFSYTSGTTGPPKGAMLSHRNITSFLYGFVNHDVQFAEGDVYLSFLPLPHAFERVVFAAHVIVGSYIVFYSGDMLKLKEDCQLVKPTIFCGVPRIYNKIVDKVRDQFSQKTGIAKCLVDSAVKTKFQNVEKDGNLNAGLYDIAVFNKVKEAFGGRIRKMVSGSAPLSKQNFIFMEMIMSAPMYEGYGQTENTAACFIRCLDDKSTGNVGGIIPNLEFKLADIPEMKYTSNDKDENGKSTPRGQVWMRGPAIFAGYYKLKDKTDEAITKDGWLKTGDVAVMLEGGRMKIIDRKKNIFKLQQGQYIAPQKVQDVYKQSHYVEEVFLHGESTQNSCVVIVKPAKEHFLQFAKQNNLNGSYQELCQNKQMKILLLKSLNEIGKKGGLNSLEMAKNIHLETQPFADKNILTNTMKLQRFEAKTVYKSVIESLYNQGELPLK